MPNEITPSAEKILRDALTEVNRTAAIYYPLRDQYEKAHKSYVRSCEYVLSSLLPMILGDSPNRKDLLDAR